MKEISTHVNEGQKVVWLTMTANGMKNAVDLTPDECRMLAGHLNGAANNAERGTDVNEWFASVSANGFLPGD